MSVSSECPVRFRKVNGLQRVLVSLGASCGSVSTIINVKKRFNFAVGEQNVPGFGSESDWTGSTPEEASSGLRSGSVLSGSSFGASVQLGSCRTAEQVSGPACF